LHHIPSKELGEVSSRDRDGGVVERLEHWKGWNARRESDDEGEDVDPLDEGVVTEKGGAEEGITVAVEKIALGS